MRKVFILGLAVVLVVAFAGLASAKSKAVGAGVSQSQTGTGFQNQSPGVNNQSYGAVGSQGYVAALGAVKIGNNSGSGVIGVAGGVQGTTMAGSQYSPKKGLDQSYGYSNNQGGVVYAY